eukprot:6948427-Prymnesium_polylepis.1
MYALYLRGRSSGGGPVASSTSSVALQEIVLLRERLDEKRTEYDPTMRMVQAQLARRNSAG